MTGSEKMADRYWPTPKAYAVNLTCVDCGQFAWSCPCAQADNASTGQGAEPEDAA